MPRIITTAMMTAISAKSWQPIILIQAQFSSGTVYLWSGFGSISWNSHTWIGMSALMGIGQTIEDGSTVEARGISITLSGFDSTLLADAMSDVQLGLPVTIWLGALSGPGAVIADPIMLWSGGMDRPMVDLDGQTSTITLNCENLLVSMDVAVDRRYTIEDQNRDYPGDLGMMFINSLQETTMYWGTVANSTNNI
jgi:hypothetical protein